MAKDELLPSGVRGLDEVLAGGFPAHRLFLVQGEPGTGKTTIALQFLREGVKRKERCLYVTMSETEEEIQAVAASHGWSLDGIDILDMSVSRMSQTDADTNTLFRPSEVELHETLAPALERIGTTQPQRVVLDSLSELRMLAENALRYRRRVLALKQHLAQHGCTALFLDDGTSDPDGDLQLRSIAHGVVELHQRAPIYGRERRELRVMKMRGIAFVGGMHDFAIERGGVRVYPRVNSSGVSRPHLSDVLPSGHEALDEILGGGPARGTSTLIIGPAGSGKSALLGQYAYAAAARNEPVAIFLFEESRASFLARAAGLGVPLDDAVAKGLLTLEAIDPADRSPSEFSRMVLDAVDDRGARVIGIDSLNGYLTSMPAERFLALQLHELLTVLAVKGVSTFMVLVEHGIIGATNSPVDISYVADNVLLLRFFEAQGEVRKALSVVKRRSGPHEKTIRELRLATGVIEIGEPIRSFHGILTGSPVFTGGSQELFDVVK